MDKTNLLNLAGGKANNLFLREFKRVLENIADSRVSATAKRAITITITFKPNETREEFSCEIDADSKLVKAGGVKTTIYAALEEEGLEAYNQDPGAQGLLGDFEAARRRAAGGDGSAKE